MSVLLQLLPKQFSPELLDRAVQGRPLYVMGGATMGEAMMGEDMMAQGGEQKPTQHP